jgi:hypothetical protein
MHVGLAWCVALFNVLSLLLIAKHYDDSFWCQDFHAHERLPYDSIKLINESSTENHEV